MKYIEKITGIGAKGKGKFIGVYGMTELGGIGIGVETEMPRSDISIRL